MKRFRFQDKEYSVMLKIIPEKLLEKQRKTVRATLSYSQFLSFVWGTQLSPIHEININIIYKKSLFKNIIQEIVYLTPIMRIVRRAGKRRKYLMNPPASQNAVNLQFMNSNWAFVLVIRFQLFNSSATNLCVTSSSIILAIPVFT